MNSSKYVCERQGKRAVRNTMTPIASALISIFAFSAWSLAPMALVHASEMEDAPQHDTRAAVEDYHQKQKTLEQQQPYRTRQNADGSWSVTTRMHGGRGVATELTFPQIKPSVEITGSVVRDENGHLISWRQWKERQIVHQMVFQGLKAQGHDVDKLREERAKKKSVVDEWRDKTEETRRQIEKNGPITTKNFIIPGTTPEFNEKLKGDNVGVRIENGHNVYYVDGMRLDPVEEIEKNKKLAQQAEEANKKKRFKVTTVETHASASKRTGMSTVEEEPKSATSTTPPNGAVFGGSRDASLQNGNDEPKGETEAHIQRTPPTKAYEVAPEEDRRRPIFNKLDTQNLPSSEEIQCQVEKAFPDINRQDTTINVPQPPKGRTGQSGKTTLRFRDAFFGVVNALVPTAYAREASSPSTAITPDINNSTFPKGLDENPYTRSNVFDGIVKDIKQGRERIEKSMKAQATPENASVSTATSPFATPLQDSHQTATIHAVDTQRKKASEDTNVGE